MYYIHIDKITKIIIIELSGSMSVKEVESCMREANEVLMQIKDKEYSLLALLERLDPLPQNSISFVEACMNLAYLHANKIASVHKRVVTRMQMERIEAMIINHGEAGKIIRFYSRNEAIRYLKY